jgi:hypothetical protein
VGSAPLPINTIGPEVWLTPGSISVAVDQRAALARVPTDGGQELPLNNTLIEVELE